MSIDEPVSRLQRIVAWVEKHPNSSSIDIYDALAKSDAVERNRIGASLAQLEASGRLIAEPGMRRINGKSVETKWYRTPAPGTRVVRPYKPAIPRRREPRHAPGMTVGQPPHEVRAAQERSAAATQRAAAPKPAPTHAPVQPTGPSTPARGVGRFTAEPTPSGGLRIRVIELEVELPPALVEVLRSPQ